MSRKKTTILGFSADIIGQLITQLITFIAVPIYLNNLTDIDYGYWLTIGSILIWISISDFGIGMAVGRALMKTKAKSKNEKLERETNILINSSLLIFSICSIFFLIIGIILYPISIDWFKIDLGSIPSYKKTYFLCVFAGLISIPQSVFTGVIESYQKLALNRNLNTFSNIINVLFSIYLVKEIKAIEALGYSILLSVILKTFLSIFFANKLIKLRFKYSFIEWRSIKKLFKSGGYFQMTTIANTVTTNTDSILISSFIGANFVPSYNLSSKLYQLFSLSLASKISQALYAVTSELVDTNELEKSKILFSTLVKILFRASIFCVGFIYFFNENFISLWVGNSFFAGEKLNFIICYWTICEFLIRGTTFFIYAFDNLKNFAKISLLELSLNIILSILLIKEYSLVGVAIATAISRTLTTGLYLLLFFKKKNFLTKKLFYKLMKILLISIPTFIFFYLLKKFLFEINWMFLILIGVFGIIVNFLSFDFMKLLRYKNEYFKNLLKNSV